MMTKGKGIALGAAGLLAIPLLLVVGGSSHAAGTYCTVAVGAGGADGPGEQEAGGTVAAAGIELDQDQTRNARTIVQVAQAHHLPTRAAAIGLMTAMQESSLRTPGPYPGHDAAGLFQQRSVVGWGTPQQVMDPVYAATAFLTGVHSIQPPIPGLVDIQGWETMDMADAAEAVQVSGVGNEYRKWEQFGVSLAAALGGGDSNATGVTCTDTVPVSLSGPAVTNVINRAMSQLGVPYVWGGGTPSGKSTGFCGDHGEGWLNGECFAANNKGFDCSSLVQFAWAPYIQLPRVTGDQYDAGTHIPLSAVQSGDLVFWYSPAKGIYHVAMVLQGGPQMKIIEAPHTGLNVRIRDLSAGESNLMDTAVRLTPPAGVSGGPVKAN